MTISRADLAIRLNVQELSDNSYQESKFVGEDRLVSIKFPQVKLSVEQVLRAGR
ncbi:MAG: hypothetical protein AAF716_09820 [Cyanobacteria bacterium P01_D01_bin.1]